MGKSTKRPLTNAFVSPTPTTGEMDERSRTMTKIVIRIIDICGIAYHVDAHGNIYKTDDILREIDNPAVIGHWDELTNKLTWR